MSEVQVYRLMIPPQTKINISDNERWILVKDDDYLLWWGKKKRQQQIEEKAKRIYKEDYYVNRKRYMLTYYDYKRKVKELFLESGLREFPTNGAWFKFYVPMPKSWSKKKKNLYCFECHQSTPDASNFHKALEDSCSVKDRINWDYRASKWWYNGTGHIEITIGELPPANGYSKYVREDKIK